MILMILSFSKENKRTECSVWVVSDLQYEMISVMLERERERETNYRIKALLHRSF